MRFWRREARLTTRLDEGVFQPTEPDKHHQEIPSWTQRVDETSRRQRFVAFGRASRWVLLQIQANGTAVGVKNFLTALPRV